MTRVYYVVAGATVRNGQADGGVVVVETAFVGDARRQAEDRPGTVVVDRWGEVLA